MATVTDVLETIITLKGADSAIAGFSRMSAGLLQSAAAATELSEAQASLAAAQVSLLAPVSRALAQTTVLAANLVESVAGFHAMAAAEGVATAATTVLTAAVDLLTAPLVIVTGLLAALASGFVIAGKALAEFSRSEEVQERAALRLRNLGNAIPLRQMQDLANHLQEITGIDDDVIVGLGAMAAGWGLNAKQIENLLPKILDISQGLGKDPQEVLNTILRASRGRPQGLVRLGIDPAKIRGDLRNVDNLINQVGRSFNGVAAGFRNTLPGTVHALSSSLGDLFKALGRFVGPVVVPLLNLLIKAIDKATDILNRVADFLHLPNVGEASKAGGQSELALKGDPEQTAYLRQTAHNTEQLAEAFIKSVLGGAGVVARQSFTARDAKLAFGI